jgi:hypothetical protein
MLSLTVAFSVLFIYGVLKYGREGVDAENESYELVGKEKLD